MVSALVLASTSLSVLKVLSSAGSSLILLLAQVIFDTFLGIEANGSEVRSCSSTLYSISLFTDLLTAHPIAAVAAAAASLCCRVHPVPGTVDPTKLRNESQFRTLHFRNLGDEFLCETRRPPQI